jgi:sulfur carrier protein
MKATINGETKDLTDANFSIGDLLVHEKVSQPEMVAVQLNGDLVPKERFATTLVHDKDEVDFVYFMGGGS